MGKSNLTAGGRRGEISMLQRMPLITAADTLHTHFTISPTPAGARVAERESLGKGFD